MSHPIKAVAMLAFVTQLVLAASTCYAQTSHPPSTPLGRKYQFRDLVYGEDRQTTEKRLTDRGILVRAPDSRGVLEFKLLMFDQVADGVAMFTPTSGLLCLVILEFKYGTDCSEIKDALKLKYGDSEEIGEFAFWGALGTKLTFYQPSGDSSCEVKYSDERLWERFVKEGEEVSSEETKKGNTERSNKLRPLSDEL